VGDFGTLVQSGGTYTYTAKDQTKWSFNSSGQITTVVDPDNLTLTYTYSSGNLSTITEPNGDVTSFAYSSGMLSTITKPGDLVTTLTRDGSGDLTQVANPDGSLVTMAYDSYHRMTSEQLGSLTTTYGYDSGKTKGTFIFSTGPFYRRVGTSRPTAIICSMPRRADHRYPIFPSSLLTPGPPTRLPPWFSRKQRGHSSFRLSCGRGRRWQVSTPRVSRRAPSPPPAPTATTPPRLPGWCSVW
jgi:YD repeat-containing protein